MVGGVTMVGGGTCPPQLPRGKNSYNCQTCNRTVRSTGNQLHRLQKHMSGTYWFRDSVKNHNFSIKIENRNRGKPGALWHLSSVSSKPNPSSWGCDPEAGPSDGRPAPMAMLCHPGLHPQPRRKHPALGLDLPH